MHRTKWRSLIGVAIPIAALIAAPAGAQDCMAPPAGIVGWWPGDGDSIDLESGLHGVALNGAGYAPGLVGEAFAFNGIDEGQDDRVDLPPSALDGLTDVTIEMWVQTIDDMGAFYSGASPQGSKYSNEAFLFQATDGVVVATRQTGTGSIEVFLNDGAWHHVAVVRSGSTGSLYVDGVPVDIQSVPPEAYEIGPGGLMLGQEQDCLGGCFALAEGLDGLIDEFTIYDRALSDSEILAIFEAGEAGKCKPISYEELLQEIHDLNLEMDGLNDVLGTCEAEANTCEAELSASGARIAELEAESEALQARIDELEAEADQVAPHPCDGWSFVAPHPCDGWSFAGPCRPGLGLKKGMRRWLEHWHPFKSN